MQLKSHVTGIDWLPITNPAGATQLALLHQFKQSEWLTEMQLKSLQFQQLQHLITHARKTVPYYKEVLQSLPTNLHPHTLKNLWHEIPVLTRSRSNGKGERIRINTKSNIGLNNFASRLDVYGYRNQQRAG